MLPSIFDVKSSKIDRKGVLSREKENSKELSKEKMREKSQ